jgi:hypothetical protein
MKEIIRRILREELEWGFSGEYDYQRGYCHYFAYRLKKLYPNKDIKYYILFADEIYDYDEGIVEGTALIHVYIKIDNYLLDSNGFTTIEDANKRMKEWIQEMSEELPDDYRLEGYVKETRRFPTGYINKTQCDLETIKKDIKTFLSNPEVIELLKMIE